MKNHDASHSGAGRRLGGGMIVAAWLVIMGLLTAYFSGWLDYQNNPNGAVNGIVSAEGVREISLRQNRHGHYVADGTINGERVTFLLDTGATEVSIPAVLAKSLGLRRGAPGRATTANGTVITYTTRLESVTLGTIELHQVRAHINPGMSGSEVLLGMSFLRELEFTQRRGTLTIRQYPREA